MPKKRAKHSIMIPLRLGPELVRELDILALKTNRYRSEIIRESIHDLIQKYKLLEKSKHAANPA